MSNFVIGIDLGGAGQKTTGVCILKSHKKRFGFLKPRNKSVLTIKVEQIFPTLKPFLSEISAIAVDALLSFGRGKGKMRLYEKFLSQKVFRNHHVQPLPPALMPQIVLEGIGLVQKLKEFGFVLNRNLIEVFPTFTKKILRRDPKSPHKDQHRRDAFICAYLAHLHFQGKTFWLGYHDGKLFLPDFKLWKKSWQEKFKKAWQERHPYKYKFLRTNLFDK